jgi:hypothetical protein
LCRYLTDLTGLLNSTSIDTLNLHGVPHTTDLWPLGTLSELRQLDLSVQDPSTSNSLGEDLPPAVDLIPLASCGQLTDLNLRWRKIEDLSPLAACANLQQIQLDNCPHLDRTTGLGSCLQLTAVSQRDSDVRCNCDRISCTRLTM